MHDPEPDASLNESVPDIGFPPAEPVPAPPPAWQPAPLVIEAGSAMPVMDTRRLPLLKPGIQGLGSDVADGKTPSQLAEGMTFTGNAELRSACSVSGQVQGNLTQAPGAQIAVIVTETGQVRGDIVADKISVMGDTEGLLDAGNGHVSLHDSARVSGRVRYGRIQVNGADLNATLERVPVQTGSR